MVYKVLYYQFSKCGPRNPGVPKTVLEGFQGQKYFHNNILFTLIFYECTVEAYKDYKLNVEIDWPHNRLNV